MLNLKNVVLEMLEKSKVSRSEKSSIRVCRHVPMSAGSGLYFTAAIFLIVFGTPSGSSVLAHVFKISHNTLLSELIPALIILEEPFHSPRQCKMHNVDKSSGVKV